MIDSSAATVSSWLATAQRPVFSKLEQDLQTDVCIIGAGMAGLSAAYLLAKAGRSVVVLEAGEICSGETGRTTAHIASALDDRYYELERLHGEAGARIAAQSHAAAIDRIESIARDEGIDCDFTRLDGYLFDPPGCSSTELQEELAAARRAGLAVEMVGRAPIDFDTGPCVRFLNQGQFHPLKFLYGLSQIITRAGGRIFTRTFAREVVNVDRPQILTADNQVVTCNSVIVATNTPMNDQVVMHTKQAAYRSYVIGLRIPAGSVPQGLYWDTLDPYHYVRLQTGLSGHDLLIVGGEDHKTGQGPHAQGPHDPAGPFANLEAWTRERFPQAQRVEFRWSGQILEPVDGMAFIGRNPADSPNVYIATGDSGNGITHGMIAGILLTDLITGTPNEWESLYDPSRKNLKSAGTFAHENLNVAAQYRDYVTPGEVDSEDQVAPGAGALLRSGVHKIALYRDEAGQLHRLSPICPHLRCIVRWNGVEKSWDCPCHGSRFTATGQLLNGPAISDLPPA